MNTSNTGLPTSATRTRPQLADAALRRVLELAPRSDVEATPVPEGRYNWCWRVDTDRGRFLLKVNHEQGIRHLRRVATATRRAAAAGVLVPEVVRVDVDDDLGPHLVQRWHEGRTLGAVLDDGGAVSLGDTTWVALGRQMAFLHKGSLSGLGRRSVLDAPARWHELRGMLDAAGGLGILDPALEERIVRRARTLLDTMTDQRSVLAHLDIHPGNLLVAGDSRIVLLDFDHAGPADPIYDFVKVQLWCTPCAGAFELVRLGYSDVQGRQQDSTFRPALAFYRLVNHVSYCLYWSTRDPSQIGEWVSALHKEMEES